LFGGDGELLGFKFPTDIKEDPVGGGVADVWLAVPEFESGEEETLEGEAPVILSR
jgi:hypothetical protein